MISSLLIWSSSPVAACVLCSILRRLISSMTLRSIFLDMVPSCWMFSWIAEAVWAIIYVISYRDWLTNSRSFVGDTLNSSFSLKGLIGDGCGDSMKHSSGLSEKAELSSCDLFVMIVVLSATIWGVCSFGVNFWTCALGVVATPNRGELGSMNDGFMRFTIGFVGVFEVKLCFRGWVEFRDRLIGEREGLLPDLARLRGGWYDLDGEDIASFF